jgi:hypothetical protein
VLRAVQGRGRAIIRQQQHMQKQQRQHMHQQQNMHQHQHTHQLTVLKRQQHALTVLQNRLIDMLV